MDTSSRAPWRVLLVDDDEDEFILTRDMLAASREDQYRLDWRSNCQTGLDAMLCEQYDAVLVDYRLGSDTGIDLIREARGRGCAIPMILITAMANQELDREAMLAGAADYLDRSELSPALLERALRYNITNARAAQQAQSQIEAERSLLNTVIEKAPSAIFMTDTHGRFTVINPEARSLFPVSGVTGDASGPEYGYTLCHMDGTPFESQELPLVRSLRGETIENLEMVIHHLDGRKIFTLVNSSPILQDGKISGAVAVMRDITDYVRAQQVQRESDQRDLAHASEIEALMNAVPAAIWIARDPESKIIDANRYGYEILRMLPGQNTSKSAGVDEAPRHFTILKDGRELLPEEMPVQVAARGIPVKDFEYDIVFDDGETFHMLGNATPIFKDGRPSGSVSAFIDITGRKEDQAHIEIQRRIIDQREQERLQIARDLHDGPLQIFTGLSYTIQNLLEETEHQPELNRGIQELKRDLHAGIAELRSYASELRPPTLSSFGLEKAIAAHLGDFRRRHPEIEVAFEARQVGAILPEAPRMAMYRIYQELMNNVARHAQATAVKISFQKTLEDAELIVQDNGKGFIVPTDWLDLARHKHLGLVGLRERAEAVGGRVEINSAPGRGATVRVLISFTE